jgi:hypothetical protein
VVSLRDPFLSSECEAVMSGGMIEVWAIAANSSANQSHLQRRSHPSRLTTLLQSCGRPRVRALSRACSARLEQNRRSGASRGDCGHGKADQLEKHHRRGLLTRMRAWFNGY